MQLHLELDDINSHEFSCDHGDVEVKNKNHGNLDSNSYITSTDCLKGLRRNFKLLGWFYHRVEMSGFNEFLDYLIIQISNATWHFVGNKPLLITKREAARLNWTSIKIPSVCICFDFHFGRDYSRASRFRVRHLLAKESLVRKPKWKIVLY